MTASITRTHEGNWVVEGDLDFGSIPKLLSGKSDFPGSAPEEATVDLCRAGRVDSAGLALMLDWSRHARSQGVRICYRNVPGKLIALAGLCGVAAFLELA